MSQAWSKDRLIALQRTYWARGYDVCDAVFTPERCAELISAAYRFDQVDQGIYKPLMHPHRTEPAFMDAVCDPAVISIMETVLGGSVQGLQSEFFFGKPGTLGFSRHQDNFYVRSDQDSFASIWVALNDVTADNGSLFITPGTHREPILDTRETDIDDAGNQDVNAHRIECILPDGYKAHEHDVPLPTGSAAVFHGHTVHGSNPIRSRRWRPALLLTYVRAGAPFRTGNFSKRRRIDVSAKRELEL